MGRQTVRAYYQLAKPGIVYGNAMTAAAAYLLASHRHVAFGYLLGMIAGISLVMAAACVFNNYLDRGIDTKMARTKRRALVTGEISGRAAIVYGVILGAIGFILLGMYTNVLTVWLGVIAFIMYVVVYGIAKRKTVYGTLIGAIPGALPPVAGYTAVTSSLDMGALLLFIIMVFWQMPHFYAIAMYRRKEYAAAGIPVLPVVYGMGIAQRQVMLYIVGFIAASLALMFFGYGGATYGIVMLAVGTIWLMKGVRGYNESDKERWAKKMFFFSLTVLLVFSLMIAVAAYLP